MYCTGTAVVPFSEHDTVNAGLYSRTCTIVVPDSR